MSSLNFTLLQEKTPQLYQIAAFAEEYVYSDPQSSIAKARLFAERITTILYKAYRIEVPQASSFVDLLQNEEFRKQVPSVILHKLNFIRKIANGIVHGGDAKSAQALQLLQEIYEVSKWFAAIALGVKAQDYPDFTAPKQKKQIINEEKIDAANIKLQKTLDEFEKLKLELAAVKTAKESNKIAVDELKYSEEQTRKHLIDAMIRAAHWNISTDGSNTDEVGQEVEVDSPLKIAISVDMMDTGIDVPEVVNLVFAKPVKSKVKFWQMIGRGTRLCKDLFGRGKDKLYFKIFDHWQNFAYFEQDDNKKKQIKAPEQKSLMQKIFENRMEICKLAQSQQNSDIQQQMVDQLSDMINQLPENSISVKEKWKEKRFFAKKENLDFTKADTEVRLKADLAKLMQWIDIQGHAPSFRFDNLVTGIEKSMLQKKPCEDLQQKMIEKVALLPTNLHKVAARQETINKVLSSEFWQNVTFAGLEEIRQDLRDLMYLAEDDGNQVLPPRILNISEDEGQIVFERVKKLYPKGLDAYKRQITDILQNIIDTEPVIQKIKSGQGLTGKDFEQILSLIMVQNPSLDKQTLQEFFPSTEKLEQVLMTISGMDETYIKAKFADFVQKYHLADFTHRLLTTEENCNCLAQEAFIFRRNL